MTKIDYNIYTMIIIAWTHNPVNFHIEIWKNRWEKKTWIKKGQVKHLNTYDLNAIWLKTHMYIALCIYISILYLHRHNLEFNM